MPFSLDSLSRNLKAKRLRPYLVAALLNLYVAPSIMAVPAEKHWPPTSAEDTYILRYESQHKPVLADKAMVVSQSALASQIGIEILSQGGNAVDAAVATGFALAITLPRAGNLGGGGFMMIYIKAEDRVVAIDYRGEAPAAANQGFYLKQALAMPSNTPRKIDRKKTKTGHTASTVPGTVAGLFAAHKRWGKLPWRKLLQPAIKLANKGIIVSPDLAWALNAKALVLSKNPEACSLFFDKCRAYAKSGSRIKMPELAKTLKLIAQKGHNGFYAGVVASKIEQAMVEHGGLIRRSDLANYQARVIEPLSQQYRDHTVFTMPPPAGGLPLLQTLAIMNHFPLRGFGAGSAKSLHVMAEAMKRAYVYRWHYLGDPRFTKVPEVAILDPALNQQLAKQISLTHVSPKSELIGDLLPDSPNTTHFSVVDQDGNAVANTYTLSASFGSGVIIKGTGILMNNQMNNFSYRTELSDAEYKKVPNGLSPGQRPKSTQAPNFVFKDKSLKLVTGTPGGRRIITTVAQLISNVVDHQMNIAEATNMPRIHQGYRSEILEHEDGFSPDTLLQLRNLGHKLKRGATMGSTQSILLDQGHLEGAADPRRPGALAVGLD